MRPVAFACLVPALLLLSACETQPEMQEVQSENQRLQTELSDAREAIDTLEAEKNLLQRDVDELERVIDVLDAEKSSRVRESSQLRGQVRGFVQQQIDALQDFLVQGDLLDYVGGELVERSTVADEEPLFLVDLGNPIPRAGSLTGVGGHFVASAELVVKVLRPMDDGLVVIWESQPLTVERSGIHQLPFPVNVGVEEGDVIGYAFADHLPVSFDEGTGDTRYLNESPALGETIERDSLQGERFERAYSLGVYGLLH